MNNQNVKSPAAGGRASNVPYQTDNISDAGAHQTRTFGTLGAEIKNQLMLMADKDYLRFHSSLCPGCDNILGVRTPKLKAYAKQLAKESGILSYMDNPSFEFAEEIMLYGFILSLLKLDDYSRLPYIKKYVPHITSWAVCDSPTSAFKFIQKNRDFYYPLLEEYFASGKEYETRFAIVALLAHYMTEAYIDDILRKMAHLSCNAYYVKMAAAWTLSVCYIHFPEKTLALFKSQTLDTFVHNKAIQKTCESLRVTKEDKTFLRSLKISD